MSSFLSKPKANILLWTTTHHHPVSHPGTCTRANPMHPRSTVGFCTLIFPFYTCFPFLLLLPVTRKPQKHREPARYQSGRRATITNPTTIILNGMQGQWTRNKTASCLAHNEYDSLIAKWAALQQHSPCPSNHSILCHNTITTSPC